MAGENIGMVDLNPANPANPDPPGDDEDSEDADPIIPFWRRPLETFLSLRKHLLLAGLAAFVFYYGFPIARKE